LENWVFDQIRIAKTIALDKDIIALSKNPIDENLRQVVKSRLLQIHAIYPQAEAIDVCPKLKKDEKIIKMIDGKVLRLQVGKFLFQLWANMLLEWEARSCNGGDRW